MTFDKDVETIEKDFLKRLYFSAKIFDGNTNLFVFLIIDALFYYSLSKFVLAVVKQPN